MNYEKTQSLFGDAIYETTQNAVDNTDAWFETRSEMLYNIGCFFSRGGSVISTTRETSLFYFTRTDGRNLKEYSFRPIMVVY